jgi:hypothetical protein
VHLARSERLIQLPPTIVVEIDRGSAVLIRRGINSA